MWNNMPKRWYEAYERGRPSYPPEAVGIPGVPSSATVLDLGAGTGKLTRLLVATFFRVVGVEPDDEMRRLLVARCPDAEALTGTAEQIPLADASVDAVFAAQSFHWFANDRALAEIGRVLRPLGTLVLMWNLRAGPTEPSIATVEHLLEPHWPKGWDLPLDLGLSGCGHASGDWRLAFEQSAFEELREARLPNPQTVDPAGLVAFFASMGWIDGLPDEDRLPLLEQVRSLLTAAEYRLPWETHVHWTRLAAASERRYGVA
jgi:SAM-dependent methyltransferase